jgi:hypothetical protein
MGIKVAWYTEGPNAGRIPRNYPGMRNDSAWMCVLGADHHPLHKVDWWKAQTKPYDLGIITIPKKKPEFDVNVIKSHCHQIATMQEGPHWYFQERG